MKLDFWDLRRTPGPSRQTARWMFACAAVLALLTIYAIATSSRWAAGALVSAGVVLVLALMYPRADESAGERQPRMHQTLDLPIPETAFPRWYRWLIATLPIGLFLVYLLLMSAGLL